MKLAVKIKSLYSSFIADPLKIRHRIRLVVRKRANVKKTKLDDRREPSAMGEENIAKDYWKGLLQKKSLRSRRSWNTGLKYSLRSVSKCTNYEISKMMILNYSLLRNIFCSPLKQNLAESVTAKDGTDIFHFRWNIRLRTKRILQISQYVREEVLQISQYESRRKK